MVVTVFFPKAIAAYEYELVFIAAVNLYYIRHADNRLLIESESWDVFVAEVSNRPR